MIWTHIRFFISKIWVLSGILNTYKLVVGRKKSQKMQKKSMASVKRWTFLSYHHLTYRLNHLSNFSSFPPNICFVPLALIQPRPEFATKMSFFLSKGNVSHNVNKKLKIKQLSYQITSWKSAERYQEAWRHCEKESFYLKWNETFFQVITASIGL